MNSKFLTDKVALVTGASRGLGKAIALALAAEGASIAAVARSEEALADTLEAIRAAGGTAEPYRARRFRFTPPPMPSWKKSQRTFSTSMFWSTTPASRAMACSCA